MIHDLRFGSINRRLMTARMNLWLLLSLICVTLHAQDLVGRVDSHTPITSDTQFLLGSVKSNLRLWES
jgi:hypothetical protein